MDRFVCDCGRQYEIRQVGVHSEMTTRRQRQARRKAKRQTYRRYNFEAEGIMPQAPELRRGEELKIETPLQGPTYEANVGVPIGQALMYGGGAALLSILPTVYFDVLPWFTPFLIWPTVTGGAVFITPRSLRKLLIRVEEWTGQDIDGDGQVGTQPRERIPIEHNRDKDGRAHRRYDDIPCPKAGELKLAEWFYLICRSGGRGLSLRGGKRFGIEPAEVGAVQDWFLTQIPPEATQASNNWIRPNDDGFDTMWGVVTRNIPDATLPPDRV